MKNIDKVKNYFNNKENNISLDKHVCAECGKGLKEEDEVYYCANSHEYFCYEEETGTMEFLLDTCIGKNLLKCGYSEEYIWKIFNSHEYSVAFNEGTLDELLDEKGQPYIEVFYTTV